MNYRFHIIDRNNVSTEIEEPVGFDAFTCNITRDKDWHGIFFNNSGDSFEFYGAAAVLLKDEHDEYGAAGIMSLLIEEECNGAWTELDSGQFVFSNYEWYCNGCYVKCSLEAVNDIMDLRNRVDQKVDMDSAIAFDETTILAAYERLGFDIELPSKAIFMQNKAEMAETEANLINLGTVPDILYDTSNVGNYNYAWFQIVPQLEKVDFSEFGSFITAASPEHEFIKSGWYNNLPETDFEQVIKGSFTTPRTSKILFDWATASALLLNDRNSNNFDSVQSFSLDVNYSFDMDLKNVAVVALYNVIVIMRKDGTYQYIDKSKLVQGLYGTGYAGFDNTTIWQKNSNNTVSFSGSYSGLNLQDGDYLFVVVCGLAAYANTDATAGLDAYNISSNSGSVNMESLTLFQKSNAKVYAINESLSHISEAITNDKLRVYSEYFGRTDSQPYAVDADGCGSLEVITDGLRIRRQEDKIADQTTIFSLSLTDIFNGLCPIHNIGMGVETDPNRTGFDRLRVEQWQHFYNDTLVMSCTGINDLSRKVNEKELYSIFQFGYAKWEAQAYNGLDEFLTKREYRTTLSQINNTLAQISTFIGSGYALEVTRRLGNTSTSDSTYDNETFIICIKRGGVVQFIAQFQASNTIKIACLGGNYTLAESVFYPGAAVDITGNINTGTFNVTATSRITNYLVVTVSETIVNETNVISVPDNTGFSVELGNITGAANIVDPGTIYNFRISPFRNAMRWMNSVLRTYKKFTDDSKILFTSGDGNYLASGEMESDVCRLENASVQENQTINRAVYDDQDNAQPLLEPERIAFTYPMTANDYQNLKANPGGKIYFESDCDEGYGWIDTITWTPDDGTATFSLIPKYEN